MVKWDWGWAGWWSGAYLLNLIVPLSFGLGVTAQGGRIGMGIGVAVCWTLGLVVCAWRSQLRLVLVVGAAAIAMTQLVPILHIIAGAGAMDVWASLSGGIPLRGEGPAAVVAGLAVTLFTASPLVLAALLCGQLLCWSNGWREATTADSPDDE